jgi:hypothetical protein
VILCVALVGIIAAPTTADDAQSLRLVPFPKQVERQPGVFALHGRLVLQLTQPIRSPLAEQLVAELRRAGVTDVEVQSHTGADQRLILARKEPSPSPPTKEPGERPESYVLVVAPDEVRGHGADAAGLWYAGQTLVQLIRANRTDQGLPCLTIGDWPSLRWRCFQDDLTRGPSSTPDTLQQHIDLGAELKMNLFTYYMEYQYAFRKHPAIGPPDGSLTPDELTALVRYAQPRHIEILGNQQSFGHMTAILKHPQYAPLRETEYLLSPANEATYQLLDDLYSEVCPLLPFPMFNVCCDETWGLGTGPSKSLTEELGVGGVYVRHIRRVHDLLRSKYQKRMMMWGDIILEHPDKLDQIPQDTVMLTWGYGPAASFEHQIAPFAQAGYEFFVCPGISNWSRILPDFGVAMQNIQNFVRDGAKLGALGMLNTEWEDDGEALQGYKWHGYAWGAECAWNASTTSPADFNRRIGGVLFGAPDDRFGQAIELLAQTHRLPGMKGMLNSRFWESDWPPSQSAARARASAEQLLGIVRPAIEHLEACQHAAVVNAHLLDAYLLGARRMELIGQRTLSALRAAEAYAEACRSREPGRQMELLSEVEQLVETTRQAHAELGRQFERIWLSESEPYALDWTSQRYRDADQRYGALMARLKAARETVARGEPLPEPDEIGLVLPGSLARHTRSRQLLPEPLQPAAPWLEPQASHRWGLVIEAGDSDRSQLPVEVDVHVPAELAAKPVRAFSLQADGPAREILAQLDRSAESDKCRLVLVLPGELPRQSAAQVHVYLGLSTPPARLPEAVETCPGDDGAVILRNNAVQLTLGAEGAHVYEWRIAAAEDRDLTMPGTTGWAGFSDLGGAYRPAVNRLTCLARGPALVRYQCENESGLLKTISLFGGCSWMEVILSDAVDYYWDFDNPRNFAADGPSPGKYLFSTGETGAVGREADGVSAQVRAAAADWAIKWNEEGMALGLTTPEVAAQFVVAPGSGAGGVGIEGSRPASHFVTFAGQLPAEPARTMQQLKQTLDLRQKPSVVLHGLQPK